MNETDLKQMADRFMRATPDFARLWRVVSDRAADVVEIRHFPPSPQLDGFRSRPDFIDYVEEEARVLPLSFSSVVVSAKPDVADQLIIWNPLSLKGTLKSSGRPVEIRFRVELHFEGAHLVRVVGSPTADTPKADIVEWLKSVEAVGGFNPPPALTARPTA